MLKRWVYHATEEPKIINKDEAQDYYDNGWADSPAKFVKTTDFGVDPDDQIAVQQLGEAIEGVANMANDSLNLEGMKPKELKEFALKNFNEEIKGNREKLLTQVKGLIDDNSTRLN